MIISVIGLEEIAIALATLSLIIWAGLLTLWGRFWLADQRLDTASPDIASTNTTSTTSNPTLPSVAVIIPARNEAALIAQAIRSHLTQTYAGPLSILLVDDQSTDGTAAIAIAQNKQSEKSDSNQTSNQTPLAHRSLTVLNGKPLPSGWTGKLWAMEQGFRHLQQNRQPSLQPDYVLFTDADIKHNSENIYQLVLKAEKDQLDLVSLMVKLRCQSHWEKLLIPAFVFFFQMLYPFPWVNNPHKRIAAAAGGCALVRFSALERINGLQTIRNALIDDCALGAAIKQEGAIWLGLSTTTQSLRPYPTLESIWEMVARSAYTQLRYSPWLLAGTVVGMLLMYIASPLAVGIGIVSRQWELALIGSSAWGLMALAYWPTLKLYDGSPWLAPTLPGIAFLYLLMTLDSAQRHWRGQGGLWKGRVHEA